MTGRQFGGLLAGFTGFWMLVLLVLALASLVLR